MAVVNIAETGVVFRGEITFATAEIVDHGFVWSSNQSLDLTKVDKLRLRPKIGPGVFDGEVGFGLAEGVKYYFRAFVQSETHMVYGETLEFVSLGSLSPIIEDFTPKEATWYDTITLVGRNFAGVVKLGDKEAEIVERNDKSIKVRVPLENIQPEEFISVVFSGNSSVSRDKLKLKPPIISQVTPLNGKFGDVVTVTGNFFHPFQTQIKFDEVSAELTTLSSSQIVFKVPTGLQSGLKDIEVISGIQSVRTQGIFTYEAPAINEITPSEGTYGDLITIKGNYFGSQPGENVVKFEGEEAEIISVTSLEIKVKVPETVGVPAPKVTISYNQQISNELEFSLLPPVVTSFTPARVTTNTEVVITGTRFSPVLENNKVNFGGVGGEIVSISSTEIRVLVPDSISSHEMQIEVWSSGNGVVLESEVKSPWAIISSFPYYYDGQTLSYKHTLIAKDKLFSIATTEYSNDLSADFYEFVTSSNTLIKKADFPAYGATFQWSCFVNNKIFIGYYPFREVYVYDLFSNSWSFHSEIPYTTSNYKFGLSTKNKGYLFNYDMEYWEYEILSDSWISKSNLPDFYPSNGFGVDDKLFVFGKAVLDNIDQMWEYNEATDTWSMINGDLPGEIGYVFGVNNKGFLATSDGEFYEFNHQSYSWKKNLDFPFSFYYGSFLSLHQSSRAYFFNNNHIWEFDPNY